MKRMNCRKVRREIEDTGPDESLTSVVAEHLQDCPACHQFCQEDARLRQMTSSLGMVEAPGDFDFRLRARLAGVKSGSGSHFAIGSLVFGLRNASVAAILLLVAAGFLFMSLRTSRDLQTANSSSPAATQTDAQGSEQSGNILQPGALLAAAGAGQASVTEAKPNAAVNQKTTKRSPAGNTLVASGRNPARFRTREMGSKPATVLRSEELTAAANRDFPIGASYQSLKVSLDDGRGSSKTISLPTVSFGSQRVLAHSTSPLLASARGAW